MLRVCGAILADANEEFTAVLRRLRAEGCFRLVIDARDLDYVNSRGIGDLVSFSRDAHMNGGRLVMVRPGPSLMKTLRTVGLSSIVPSYDTIEQAVEACAA